MINDNVLLIGVGGIGFRHFQALLNCRNDFEVYIVDKSKKAIDKVKEYVEAQKINRKIHYCYSVDEIDRVLEFRIAIIATPSLPRREVFCSIVTKFKVKNILFEKVLFPRIEDYSVVSAALKEKGIAAYVNCPRRIWPVYTELRKEISQAKHSFVSIKGSNWGLACNSIHWVDLIYYLSGAVNESVYCSGAMLEDRIISSKRSGYIEFLGKLVGSIGEKATFSIECDQGNSPVVVEIYTDKAYFSIKEDDGILIREPFIGDEHRSICHFESQYVSKTTTDIIERIFNGQELEIAAYECSMSLHIPILREFLKKKNQLLKEENDLCPIT